MAFQNKDIEPMFLKLWKAYDNTKTPVFYMDFSDSESSSKTRIQNQKCQKQFSSASNSSWSSKGKQISDESKIITWNNKSSLSKSHLNATNSFIQNVSSLYLLIFDRNTV